MPKQNLRNLIAKYLKEAKVMCLATSKDGKPWACTVWFVSDNDFNLYFISGKGRRHSIELKDNPNVAGTIVKPHVKGSGEKVAGLQFEGTAAECNKIELLKAIALYAKKYPLAALKSAELLRPGVDYTFYKIKPSAIVLFDEINFPKQPRQELKLR